MNFNHDIGLIDTILTIDTTQAPPYGGATNSLQVVGTGALFLPLGNTSQRPTGSTGAFRYNTDLSALEVYNGSTWALTTNATVSSVTVTTGTGMQVSAGSTQTITTSGTFALTLSTELQGLSGLATTGILARTGSGAYAARTLSQGTGIAITNGDGVAANPSIALATLADSGTGSLLKLNRDAYGRVTGTTAVVTADITALVDATYVNASGDSMSGSLNMAGNAITNLATPSASTDAANKSYVDSKLEGLSPKGTVRVATTTNGTLATAYANGQAVDGITLVTGDLILVKNQTAPAENGIYVVQASGAPVRATNMDSWAEVPSAYVLVQVGTVNADTGWVCTSDQGGTLGTTAINWVQFFGAGTYTAGTGLSLNGTQFSLQVPVSVANGGSGLTSTPLNGQLNIGNGSGFTRATLTQGTGITVTNGAGSITVANAGVLSIAGTTNQITASASTGAVTLSLPSSLVAPGSLTVTTNLTVSGLTANAFMYSGAAGLLTTTAAPTNGQLLIGSTGAAPVAATISNGTGISVTNGAGSITIGNTGVTSVAAGTGINVSATTGAVTISNTGVTSVAVSGGTTGLTTSGGPITTSGTITLAGTLATTNGGTGLTTIGSANQVAGVNAAANALEYKTITQGAGITVTHGTNTITIASSGVTSVALSAPSIFNVTGSPITSSGTLTLTLASQINNVVFAGPATTGSVAPTFRQLVLADLTINALKQYNENSTAVDPSTVTGTNSVNIGSGNTSSATGSLTVGQNAVASLYGAKAYASGMFATAGDAQQMMLIARNTTANATITELFLDGVTATQRAVLPNNSLWTFTITIAGRRTDAVGGGAGYKFEGVIRKDANAASTTMVGAAAKSVLGETNTAWDAAVDADTSNGSLRVRVTGEASKTIRWVATMDITQVTN